MLHDVTDRRVSVLVPTRGRPDSLFRSVESLLTLAARTDLVEVLCALDDDDPRLGEVLERLAHLGKLWPETTFVWKILERRGYSRLNEYFNELAADALGEWLLLWNDDAFVETESWDDVICAEPATRVVCDLLSQLSPHLCCFPAVRRWAVEAVGGFSPHTPHCDTYWQDLGRAVPNAIDFVQVRVRHERADITGQHNDQTYREGAGGGGYRTHDFYGARVQAQIAADVLKVSLALVERTRRTRP